MRSRLIGHSMALGAVFCLAAAPTIPAHAEDAAGATPPVQAATAATVADDAAATSAPGANDTVFSWQEVPANQQVPITRAVFDAGGYELYDTVGETITVPFKDHKLDVMKFARSTTGDMYFINDGSAPVLYVPDGGYLENAAVPGSKWFPFTDDYQSTDPQYLGIAPSYSDYADMDWYPDMSWYGGYCGCGPDDVDDLAIPEAGLCVVIGGTPCYGWNAYHGYCLANPAPYRGALLFGADYGFAAERHSGRRFGGFRREGWHGRGVAGAALPETGRRDLPPSGGTPLRGQEAPRMFRGARSASGGFAAGGRGAAPRIGYRGGYVARAPEPYGGFDRGYVARGWYGGGTRAYGGGYAAVRPYAGGGFSMPRPAFSGGGYGGVPTFSRGAYGGVGGVRTFGGAGGRAGGYRR